MDIKAQALEKMLNASLEEYLAFLSKLTLNAH